MQKIHVKYVDDVLNKLRALDPEAAEKLLLVKVPVNKALRNYPEIHFYDEKLTIFGALAAITSTEVPEDTRDDIVVPIVEFFNSLIIVDPDAITGLISDRVSVNWQLANDRDFTCKVDADINGDPINPEIGLVGVLNGLVGTHENGWGKIGACYTSDGKLRKLAKLDDQGQIV